MHDKTMDEIESMAQKIATPQSCLKIINYFIAFQTWIIYEKFAQQTWHFTKNSCQFNTKANTSPRDMCKNVQMNILDFHSSYKLTIMARRSIDHSLRNFPTVEHSTTSYRAIYLRLTNSKYFDQNSSDSN